jgi:hypothetical protein
MLRSCLQDTTQQWALYQVEFPIINGYSERDAANVSNLLISITGPEVQMRNAPLASGLTLNLTLNLEIGKHSSGSTACASSFPLCLFLYLLRLFIAINRTDWTESTYRRDGKRSANARDRLRHKEHLTNDCITLTAQHAFRHSIATNSHI